MNIKFYSKFLCLFGSILWVYQFFAFSSPLVKEPVQACVIAREIPLDDALRARIANCLGWKSDQNNGICQGAYRPIIVPALPNSGEVKILADSASFYRDKPSTLKGHVEVQQEQRMVNAQTAYVYRDAKNNKINRIEFLEEVQLLEPGHLMIAKNATVYPEDKSGQAQDVIYRFNFDRKRAVLPAWGQASLIQRFANKDILLKKVTYTTCAPQDKGWMIEADSIKVDSATNRAVARNAKLRIRQIPILYTPYLSFSTSGERKSGFLSPLVGYSNIGGFSLGLPYYLNLAPNYDLTLTPNYYSERGVMLGAEYRFLTPNSGGVAWGNFLPQDRAYNHFLQNYGTLFPWLNENSTNRWYAGMRGATHLSPNMQLTVNAQQVSDDYYLQDFSTNLALSTQRQLLRQADLTYQTEHWVFSGMAQSYQTLHPVNETPVSDVYERLPQIKAVGYYSELPGNAYLNILGQYDQFFWTTERWNLLSVTQPEGPRLHINPILTIPFMKSWGFITPSAQVVENYYQIQNKSGLPNAEMNRLIPRANIDSGLFLERELQFFGGSYTQTLEPRLYYLNVPYYNQATLPIYDSANMIFNADQLFRTNRFSGFDRIGDANQLSYALTSRWLFEETGAERAYLTVGQIKYFADRRVQLCQSPTGYCIENPNAFGAVSPTSGTSPIASRAVYHFNPVWGVTGDYVWDTATHYTNNMGVNFHYQPQMNQIVNIGYNYLVNGDMTQVKQQGTQDNSLNQATIATAWPLRDKWSFIGAYNHNISKNYSMMSLLGIQYDTCCWTMRALAGRTFQSLNTQFEPQYNNNIYFQVLLKGLGSVANSDPSYILSTYLPGYNDQFKT